MTNLLNIYPELGHAERNVSSTTGVQREESRALGIREAFKEEVASALVLTLFRNQQDVQGCGLAVGFAAFGILKAWKTAPYTSTR